MLGANWWLGELKSSLDFVQSHHWHQMSLHWIQVFTPHSVQQFLRIDGWCVKQQIWGEFRQICPSWAANGGSSMLTPTLKKQNLNFWTSHGHLSKKFESGRHDRRFYEWMFSAYPSLFIFCTADNFLPAFHYAAMITRGGLRREDPIVNSFFISSRLGAIDINAVEWMYVLCKGWGWLISDKAGD